MAQTINSAIQLGSCSSTLGASSETDAKQPGERRKFEPGLVSLAFHSQAKDGSCSLISLTDSERMSASVSTILVQNLFLVHPKQNL